MKSRQFFSNAKQFVIGKTRWLLYRFSPELIRPHIMEQFLYRKEACPECTSSYESRCCGCSIPDVYFAGKGCKLGKYPRLLSKKEWEDFKRRKAHWERFVKEFPGGEEELNKIGISKNEYYMVIIDIVDGAYTKQQINALWIYNKAQFIKQPDKEQDIILNHD